MAWEVGVRIGISGLEVELLARAQHCHDVAAYAAGVIDTFRRIEQLAYRSRWEQGGPTVSTDGRRERHDVVAEDPETTSLDAVAGRAAAALRSVSSYISQQVEPQRTFIDIVSAEKVSSAAANLAFAIQYLDQAADARAVDD